jgi:ABC-type Fe3+-hydroxamate transport system substrate-binding protein
MQFRSTGVIILLLCSAIAITGCTGSQTSPSSTTPVSGIPTASATSGSGSPVGILTTEPTDIVPGYNMVTVDVGEKDYLGIIPVIFQGGIGMNSVKKIDVKLTRADGTIQTATVGTRKGDEVELQGTRGAGSERGPIDRIEVWVTVNDGQTYKVADVIREYRSRG